MENIINKCIIDIPLAEIWISNKYFGLHNEYTVRNLQIAVKNKEIDFKSIKVIFQENEYTLDENGKFNKNIKGFYDLTYNLAFKLIE